MTIEHAIDRLVEAATGVVTNQLELARIDLKIGLLRIVRSAAFIVVGALLVGGACVALALMAYALFPDHVPPEQRLAVLAVVSGVGGIALATIGVRQLAPHGDRSHGGH